MGSVRDVGATLGWKFGEKVPINLQVGMFNGSGIDDQKDFWTDKFNYAAKAQFVCRGMNFVVSYQTTRPADTRIHLYDVGCSYRLGGWFFEAEYLRKEYARNSFAGVNAFDGFSVMTCLCAVSSKDVVRRPLRLYVRSQQRHSRRQRSAVRQ